jgi:large subunit ribosomal protein L9
MKVIILEDDRVENVSDGYARNFLFPRRLAITATAAALAAVTKREAKKKAEIEQRQAEMRALAEKLSELDLVITADVGEGGKLFGSVTTTDLVRALKQAASLDIDKRKIEIKSPLKTVGDYVVSVKLFRDVTAALKVKVAAK